MTDGPARLRIKPEHSPYRTSSGNVRIGGVVFGIGAELADPHGWLWTLVQALDGSRDVESAADAVRALHPGISRTQALRAITRLNEEGFLEAATGSSTLPEPPARLALTARERSRYSRGVTLLRWMDRTPRPSAWEPQIRLRDARVLVVGLGGTGSSAAQALVASGVGHTHCLDGDVVELSNLNRQLLYTEADLGRAKVTVAVDRLRSSNRDVTVSGERTVIRGVEQLTGILSAPPPTGDGARPDGTPAAGTGGFDLLLLCADDPPAVRDWANRACLATGTPWVTGGYSGPLASAGVFVPGVGGCWSCLRLGEADRRDLGLAPGQDERVASARLPWHPANAVTAGLAGLFIAHAALALLTGIPRLEPGFRYGLNTAVPGEPVLDRYPRRPDCPACGPSSGAETAGHGGAE